VFLLALLPGVRGPLRVVVGLFYVAFRGLDLLLLRKAVGFDPALITFLQIPFAGLAVHPYLQMRRNRAPVGVLALHPLAALMPLLLLTIPNSFVQDLVLLLFFLLAELQDLEIHVVNLVFFGLFQVGLLLLVLLVVLPLPTLGEPQAPAIV